jgi:uncharacterized Zn finger protein
MRDGDLRDACAPGRLRALAGEPSFQRGEEYAREGRVERLTVRDDSATATVRGSMPYRVALHVVAAHGLGGSCTCPVGETGALCKHCVAVGLMTLRRSDAGDEELRTYLASRSHAELIEFVVAAAGRDRPLRDGHDLFGDALATYADVLGEAGRARYAQLAEVGWAAAGTPSWTLSRIMERLAGEDVDRLVAIKARTLEHAWDYEEIATLLRDAGRPEDAIRWAQRGIAARSDARLREFLAECHLDAGRPDEALRQRAAQFREQPTLAAYQALHAQAEPLGRWTEERGSAMAVLQAPPRGIWPRDRSVLVAVLLWEGDGTLAWKQAHAGGCSRDLWRALARERAAERPGDAVDVDRRLLSAAIGLRKDNGYDGAIELLDELHALLAPRGHEAAHVALVSEIREVHRRKRNLIKRLDASPDPVARSREHDAERAP